MLNSWTVVCNQGCCEAVQMVYTNILPLQGLAHASTSPRSSIGRDQCDPLGHQEVSRELGHRGSCEPWRCLCDVCDGCLRLLRLRLTVDVEIYLDQAEAALILATERMLCSLWSCEVKKHCQTQWPEQIASLLWIAALGRFYHRTCFNFRK